MYQMSRRIFFEGFLPNSVAIRVLIEVKRVGKRVPQGGPAIAASCAGGSPADRRRIAVARFSGAFHLRILGKTGSDE